MTQKTKVKHEVFRRVRGAVPTVKGQTKREKTDKSKGKTGPCFFCNGQNLVKKDCRKYAMYLKGVEKSQDDKKK